jgi:putative transposase
VHVHAANIQDRTGLKQLFEREEVSGLELSALLADYGYDGEPLHKWLMEQEGIELAIARPGGSLQDAQYQGLIPQKVRWIVERTFAWMGRKRRLAKDHEAMAETTRAWMFLAMAQLVLKRLTR